VEIVTGIGLDPVSGEPLRRARVWCRWHGGHFLPISDYREAVAAQRVQEALLERAGGDGTAVFQHVATTIEGQIERVYVDGVLTSTRRL